MRMMPLLALPAMLVAVVSLAHAQNVSFSATISGPVIPGVYGQVAIGNGPPPPVVYAQPVIAQPAPVVVGAPAIEPLYLHVPPGHAKDWRRHCHEYHACNRPVYFVKSAEYEPGYRPDHHGHGHHDEDRDDHDHGHHDEDRDDHDHGHRD